MIDFKMRKGVASDANTIRALTRDAYAKWVPLIGREPKPMTADYEKALEDHRFDLLFVEETLVGLIETIPQTDHLLIENVAVATAFQGQGIGRKLLAHAESLATSSQFSQIRLYTNKRFTENILLYERLGYRADREEDSKVGVVVHMSKLI